MDINALTAAAFFACLSTRECERLGLRREAGARFVRTRGGRALVDAIAEEYNHRDARDRAGWRALRDVVGAHYERAVGNPMPPPVLRCDNQV
jgi:hypothetical protein